MPLYEYECSACKHRFELIQKFSAKQATKCVRCGAPAKRVLSTSAIHFKGTGWYVTDYGKGSASAGDESKKESKSESGDKAPAASESAPAPASKETPAASKDTPKPAKEKAKS